MGASPDRCSRRARAVALARGSKLIVRLDEIKSLSVLDALLVVLGGGGAGHVFRPCRWARRRDLSGRGGRS